VGPKLGAALQNSLRNMVFLNLVAYSGKPPGAAEGVASFEGAEAQCGPPMQTPARVRRERRGWAEAGFAYLEKNRARERGKKI
jgi:hypothetical protein